MAITKTVYRKANGGNKAYIKIDVGSIAELVQSMADDVQKNRNLANKFSVFTYFYGVD